MLFGLGFGVATAGGLRHVGTNPTVVTTAPRPQAPDQNQETNGNQTSQEISSDPTVAFDAPVFDESKRLPTGETADLVLTHGRIIDPETGFDRIGNVAVTGTTIVEISQDPLPGDRTVDVGGQVISPGFIDVLSASPNGYGEWFKVADGVTSNFGMHGIRSDAAAFYPRWAGAVPVNFGGAVHNSAVRNNIGLELHQAADGEQINIIKSAVREQLQNGYLGVHVQPEYAPGVSATELMDMGTIAEESGVPLCVHARFSDNTAPGIQSDAIAELVEVARTTGCHVHVEHLNSTGGTGRMTEALAQISDALTEGLRMSSCMYPYGFWATYLQSTRYNDWQEKFGLSYEDLQVAGTNERLNATTYAAALEENKLTAAYAIPDTDLVDGLQAPFMMIGSDAILETSHNNHPRATGCFARTLGLFARERAVVSLVDALAMMTVRPANLLAISAPDMARKGRMQIGADADVTVFDPATIIDRSTIETPQLESNGVSYVFVNGVEVRNPGGNVGSATPGLAVRSQIT